MQQRLGPNIENIADDKKPYQGDDQKKLLDAPTDQGRRVSPRLRNIPDCKKPYYGSGKKKFLEAPEENTRKKNIKIDHSIEICQVNMAREFAEDESGSNDMDTDSVPIENSENSEGDDLKWTGCSNSLVDKFGKSTFVKMKETLRLFNLHCLRIAKDDYHGYTFPLTVTIALSGQHGDDVDNSEVVYNCLGGNDLHGNKTEVVDQVMHLGNMALKNNVKYCVPVRVIHGQECAHAYTGKVYTYDGLYKVVNCSADNNNSGVFKYRLKRLKGQPKLASKNQDHFIREQISKDRYQSVGLVCIDISIGQEDICIPATNVIDNPPFAPSGFTYINSIQVAKNVIVPPDAPGCNCKGTCISSRSCSCAQLNGFDFPYVRRNGGRLIEAKDVVFECGPRCACGPGCVNRTTQLGLRYQLEVFRTEDKGWAVRSWDFIPSGAPVCEYAGVLRRSDELDNVSENDFIFEIDCWQTMNEIGGRERRLRNVSVPTSNLVEKKNDELSENTPEFCIDAGLYGNVARFINHSCEPNLFVQCILSSHHDIRLARVVLFAADDIPPMQELTYDYGYKLDSVVSPDGKIKKMPCNCGTVDCRRRLY